VCLFGQVLRKQTDVDYVARWNLEALLQTHQSSRLLILPFRFDMQSYAMASDSAGGHS
jgi:hypothetical protein